jgi:hypothetical protein
MRVFHRECGGELDANALCDRCGQAVGAREAEARPRADLLATA